MGAVPKPEVDMYSWSDYLFDIILGFFALFFAVYLAVIFLLSVIWRFKDRGEHHLATNSTNVSIVVAYRNELKRLPSFISALNAQLGFDGSIELIAINDHSDDGGDVWMTSQTLTRGSLILIDAEGRGKKSAIREGILVASGELIVTCDADCVPSPTWLNTIETWYRQKDADMLAGPVRMLPGNTLIGQYDAVDYFSLQLSSAAAMKAGFPVFCSAANMAFRKTAWEEAQSMMDGQTYLSGDDVFLLHALKKLGKRIVFVADPGAVVDTFASGSIATYFRQRVRWGGKSCGYRDVVSIILALTVFGANLFLLALLIYALAGNFTFWLFACAFGIKAVTDYYLLSGGKRVFKVSLPLYQYLPIAVVYPLILVLTAAGAIVLPEQWKRKAVTSTGL